MVITALGYLGVRSDRLSDWSEFASGLLGMQLADRGGKNLSFRMDDRKQRFVVSDEPGETLAFMGWEVERQGDLQSYASRLDKAGFAVKAGSRDLCDRRFVSDLVWFHDPDGNRIELVWKPETSSTAFVPGRSISGFNTGPLGMGHAVLHVRDANILLPFYRDLLDFKVSDYGMTPYPMYFFHVNSRHHSFAMIGSGNVGFHHFMVEFTNLDDVGQGYDLASQDPDVIAYTLGRHTNDYATSFYAHTPSNFFVESGWGVRVIEPETWEPHETFCGPSFWGHDRPYMADEPRERLKEMKLTAAAEGLRTPPVIDCPWLYGELKRR
jgi:2,3-dihydroxybiphenyl 1,2-dioxygenase